MNITKTPKMAGVETIKHCINVGEVRPIKQCPIWVPVAKREITDNEEEKMLVQEIIRPSIVNNSCHQDKVP